MESNNTRFHDYDEIKRKLLKQVSDYVIDLKYENSEMAIDKINYFDLRFFNLSDCSSFVNTENVVIINHILDVRMNRFS